MKKKDFYYRAKKIKSMLYVGLMVLLIGISTSCGNDDDELAISLNGPVLSVSDFSGDWTATAAVFENISGSERIEIVAQGGSVTFVAKTNGRFSITINIQGQSPDIFSGELGFNEEEWGSRLIVIFDGEAREDYEVYNIDFDNDTLYLRGQTTYDITGNGTEEPVIIDLTLVRS